MSKLSFQDAFFLRAETPTCPFHVASLMVFTPPEDAPKGYIRRIVAELGKVNQYWPVFGRRLKDPLTTRNPEWVTADGYDPDDHVLHYRLPEPGRQEDLLKLIARAHERLLDRTRPLWQVHIIEGLEKGRFALYFKVHHALIDGVGGLKLVQELLSPDPAVMRPEPAAVKSKPHHDKETVGEMVQHAVAMILRQAKAVPEATSLFAGLGIDKLLKRHDVPQLPFSAPHTILNTELGSRRQIITADLSLARVRAISKHFGCTINDVLIAICGSALRQYLLTQDALPRESLDAGIPVSVKSPDGTGNQLSMMICPFSTDEKDPVKRLRHIIKTTRKAKNDISHLSPDASEDLASLTMIPFLLLTVTHSSQRVPPVFNTIVSNVPGPKQTLYLAGSKLERLYPISIVADGMGLNITVISYESKLCIGITAAPDTEQGIGALRQTIKRGYEELWAVASETA